MYRLPIRVEEDGTTHYREFRLEVLNPVVNVFDADYVEVAE